MADEQRLVVLLEARINKLEKGMQKAARSTDRAMDQIERRGARASRKLESDFQRSTQRIAAQFQSMGAGLSRALAFAGVGAGALGLNALVQRLQRTVQEVRSLASEAERAGVAFEAFQRLEFLARAENVSLDALTDGLKELQLRADEFIVTGKGPASEAFQRLGFDAQSLATALRDPEQLFLTIIDRLRALDTAAQIRVADEVFGGTGGEQFVQILDRSQDKIEETLRSATVLSQETADRAQEVGERFDDVWRIIDTKVNTALINTGYWTLEIGDRIAQWADSLGAFGEQLSSELSAWGNAPIWQQLTQWLDRRGMLQLPAGSTVYDETLSSFGSADRANALEKQRDVVARLEALLERTNDLIALPEGARGVLNIEAMTVKAEELADKLAFARSTLRSMEAGLYSLGPPGIGFTGSAARVPADRDFLQSRSNGANTWDLTDAAAAGATAVLRQFPNLSIISGYRSAAHNARVGGASGSQHLTGNAIDLTGLGSIEETMAVIQALAAQGARGFGLYPGGSLHADWRPDWSFWGTNAAGNTSYSSFAGTPQPFQDFANAQLSARQTDQNTEAVERNTAAVRDNVAAHQEAATAQQQVAAAQSAATTATADVVPAIEEVTAAQNDMQAVAQTVGNSILSTFMSLADGAGNAEQAIKRLAMQLASMVFQGAFFGSGPFGKLLGGGVLGLGGVEARAGGGGVTAGNPYLVGERGPELMVPGASGTVIPAAATRRIMNARMPSVPDLKGVGGGRAGMRLVINNYTSNTAPIQTERRRGADGSEELLVTLRDAWREDIRTDFESGGDISATAERTHGLRRVTI